MSQIYLLEIDVVSVYKRVEDEIMFSFILKRKFIQHKSLKYLPLYPQFIMKYDPIS